MIRSLRFVSRRTFSKVVAWGKAKGMSEISQDPAKCGEDSYFILNNQEQKYFGVADGVGGWRQCGVDPGEIARKLMLNCKELFASSNGLAHPQLTLAEAYWKIKYGKEVEVGSTTACIGALSAEQNGKFFFISCQLGDSLYMIIREPGEVMKVSKPGLCGYNAPQQLAVVPKKYGEGMIESHPFEAANGDEEVLAGDVIVMATDGLWDNVDVNEIMAVYKDVGSNLSEFCKQLVIAACTRPRKPDDVTIVCARV
eukprot:TRINITY_DN14531_c0_g1_i1.p1 TRINITY_DN14531_c0_g1~~TRINITY_DN14531_c0_g1_i1.p1  ORF type:complete len:254 (+),score=27.13 TRINITY_DN14531_c0_g1_i1:110-871(+)